MQIAMATDFSISYPDFGLAVSHKSHHSFFFSDLITFSNVQRMVARIACYIHINLP